jgi:hypothetical protein
MSFCLTDEKNCQNIFVVLSLVQVCGKKIKKKKKVVVTMTCGLSAVFLGCMIV